VAWDEEALVHLPAEIYFTRRLSKLGMAYVSHLFAWGEDNAELWRKFPALPAETPIHVTGNPRGDLLRPETRSYYDQIVAELRNKYGDFILLNTNFNHVNAFYPAQNLFQPVSSPGEEAEFGQAARGMPRAYAEVLRDHKQAVFEDFQRLIPELAAALPAQNIVVRPHPTENQEIYNQLAAQNRHVHVTNEGNVVPWLMAARALIHNGCTTAVEAFALDVPAISYRSTVTAEIDDGFYQLPNRLSRQCFNSEALVETLRVILTGDLPAENGDAKEALMDHHLAARSGPLACERMVDVLEAIAGEMERSPELPLGDRLVGWMQANRRRIRQSYKTHRPGSLKSKKFQRHRYPPIPREAMQARITKLQQALGESSELRLEQISETLFRIS
jgi:surface carbohydrate biosynthesis protein